MSQRMSQTIYRRMFGLKPVINASGTMTALGGSLMAPEVVEAMAEAARDWVELTPLLERAGGTIAALAGVEAACVTSGSAAGITLAAAACLAGHDAELMERLPDTEGIPNEIVIQRGQTGGFDRCLRSAGARLVEVGGATVTLASGRHVLGVSRDQVEAAISGRTVALAVILSHGCVQDGLLSVPDMAAVAHAHGLPLIVDAASELPPITHMKDFVAQGGDLVIFSGGKAIGGPNDTGFVLGREDLIRSCMLQANPHHAIGRGFKVSKEQVVGLVVALRRYVAQDFEAVLATEMARAQVVRQAFQNTPHVVPHLIFPDETGLPVPRVRLVLDEPALGVTAAGIMRALEASDPAIYLRPGYEEAGMLTVDVQVLREGEEHLVAQAIRRELGG